VKDDECWTIRHGADDYKTGKVYGQRAPLRLHARLTDSVDDFLEHWRPCLQPSTPFLFAQPRTGKPLTQDSLYQIVSRACYRYTGKRTNPHLLRDMVVTHVRESTDASEKELEALALYMGHSIQMQRTSYDRRTLETKVAPAVVLLESVNAQSGI
jgi:integrase